jgi:gas vesicle protein
MRKAANFLTGLVLGILIGGGVAMLFVPHSGENTRLQINRRLDEIRSQYQEAYEEQRERLQQRFIELKGG